ncbi:Redoxin [Cunninghamella echinulata]|nr:Redoxin [Cunninghamella echinulata]
MLRTTFQRIQRHSFHTTISRHIKAGEPLPSVEVHLSSPAETTNVYELFKPIKKGILITVPGAFTPGCSKTHVPGYIQESSRLAAEKNVDLIACVSVNDAFVMNAWGKDLKIDKEVTLLADPTGTFTKAMELDVDLSKALGNHRSKRSASIIENGIVKHHFVEPDNTGLDVSLIKNVEKYL